MQDVLWLGLVELIETNVCFFENFHEFFLMVENFVVKCHLAGCILGMLNVFSETKLSDQHFYKLFQTKSLKKTHT